MGVGGGVGVDEGLCVGVDVRGEVVVGASVRTFGAVHCAGRLDASTLR